jgi:WD40 repeat protein
VVVWNASNGDIQAKLKSELPAVSYLSFNDDGSLLAVAGSSADPRIEVWDTMAQQKIQTLIGSQGAIPAMSFQPRGDLVAASDARGVLRLWNARDGQLVHTMSATEEQTSFVSLAFTPDGNALATGAINGDIQFWDPKTGEQATLLRTGYDRVFALAFSPNGEILAVGSRDTTVRLLRLPSN